MARHSECAYCETNDKSGWRGGWQPSEPIYNRPYSEDKHGRFTPIGRRCLTCGSITLNGGTVLAKVKLPKKKKRW